MATGSRPPGRPRGASRDPEARRAALLAAAEEAIRQHGPGVSMEQIAERAQVSKATLYDNFDGKAGLTELLLERYGSRLLATIGAGLDQPLTAEQVVRGGIATFVRFIETDPEIYRFVVRHADGDALLEEIAAPVAALVRSVLEGQGDDASGADGLAHATLGAIFTATDWWSRRRTPRRSVFVDQLAAFVWAGFVGSGIRPSDEPVDLAAVARA
ncbi:MAG: TetR/AcrR family transcriptional regulator, partial [Actinobacteria bacterium]|nr:TetR/AcrR family transcriptional regulator [Actinomycetota bacterium]